MAAETRSGSTAEPVQWGKLVFIGLMYMAQTFPSAFVSSFIPSIFREQGLPLENFWIFSLPLIPYWLRWAVAPVVDTYWIRSIGRRKTWMIPCTLLAVAAYASLAFVQPSYTTLNLIVVILFMKSVFTATQEVAIDAYTVENVRPHERPKAAGLNTTFEAAGQMAALVLLGVLVDRYGWRVAAFAAALLMLAFLLPAFLRREPPPSEAVERALRERSLGMGGLFAPLVRFLRRRDTWTLVPIYVLGGLYTGALFPMLGPFLIDQGYSLTQLGLIVGGTLALGTVAGATVAGGCVERVGARPMAIILAILAIPSVLPAVWLSYSGTTLAPAATIAVLFAPTVVVATFYVVWVSLRMRFASPLQAGTDYATGAAVGRIGQTLAAAAGGPLAAFLGWHGYFLVLGVLGVLACAIIVVSLKPLTVQIAARNERETGEGDTPAASPP